ncbi:MAG: 2-oxo acid dehydrogenase subunit E2 [Synergistaceae bacterium]|jgi:pyruvate dehydrogenase E2 component (dihydrolipoamide acetyltransferase)|nr:2-oxo acid dehydrogenase subunit E2 [Synergistaceae bacterium]
MATTINMPKLGLTMNSGSVQEWKKKIGEPVKKGELLYVVATDKLTVDVESPADGFLIAIAVKEGEEVPVGAPIGFIGAEGEQAPGAVASPGPDSAGLPLPQGAGSTEKEAPKTAAKLTGAGDRPSSPKAKKLAREKGIDLSAVEGTGPNGWIVERDVLNVARGDIANAARGGKASPVAAKMAAEAGIPLESFGADGRVMKADVLARTARESSVSPGGSRPSERRIPVTPMRRVIGERMLQSVTTIPSVCFFSDVDMTALNALRAAYNERLWKKDSKVRISVNDILMKLCSKLLLENPMVNASVETENGEMKAFVLHDTVNVGFAVALTGGLLVPNVKNVEAKSLTRIAEERAELVEKARSGGLTPDEMSGGTFTISNLGMMDIGAFTPIINPPEAAILGVGTTAEKPVAVKNRDSEGHVRQEGSEDGEYAVAVRPISTFCLSADHRLVDGADAARFLSQVKELVENPDLFLL